jgi:hypothetical protein
MATLLDRLMDSAVLTNLIVKPVQTTMEAAPRLGDQIAPMQDIDGQFVRMQVRSVHAFGIGQFKAPEATPPLVDLTGREEQEQISGELLQLDEMHRISPTRWERLQSTDEAIVAQETRNIVEIGQELEIRNQRLTEKMRWDAFKGTLIAQYQQADSVIQIDYPKPTGHNPVLTGTNLWTDTTNADPIANIRTWQAQVAASSGFQGTLVHLSSDDWELIVTNTKVKTYFNVPSGQPFRPQPDDLVALLAPGTQFVITDAGYRPASVGSSIAASDHVRYLPVGNVMITTPYSVEGQRIADTPNGEVQILTGYNSTRLTRGPVSELKLDTDSYNYFLRHASRRIPRILRPECFLWATVR